MTSVEIPWDRIADLSIRPRLFTGTQEGVLGGPDLAVPHMGDRFAVDIVTTRLRQDAQSRLLIAALMEASTADARIELRLPNAGPAIAGVVEVDGTGQAGSLVALRGFYRQTAIRRGGFFSIVHAGIHHVHMVSRETMADASGRAQVAIWPMLRFITTDGDDCHFVRPMIEGQLIGFDRGATFRRNRTEPLTFGIQERR